MAISLVQSAEGTSAVAVTSPSFSGATTSGNLIVLCFSSDDYNGTPDSGWTQSTGMEQQTFHGGYIWWRISTGETSVQYTIGSATVSSWVLMEFSGTHASPYDISNGQLQATSTSSYTTPSIIPTSGGRLLVAALGGSHSGGSDLSGDYTGWTNSFTFVRSAGQSSGQKNPIGAAYRLVTGDGSTGFSTGANYPNTVQSKSGMIIAFKEAAAGGATVQGQGSFAGAGAATASAIKAKFASAAFVGAGNATASVTLLERALASLAGQGSFVARTGIQAAEAILSGAGGMSASTALLGAISAAFAGQGGLLAGGVKQKFAAADLAGAGQLSVSGSLLEAAAATFAGSGAFQINAPLVPAQATFSGAGLFTVGGTAPQHQAAAGLSGAGAFSAGASLRAVAEAAFTGAGAFAPSAGLRLPAQAQFSGAGGFSAVTGQIPKEGNAALAGAGAFSANASYVLRAATVSFSGAGLLGAETAVRQAASAALAGSGAVAAGASLRLAAAATYAGSGALAAAAVKIVAAQAMFVGAGRFVASPVFPAETSSLTWGSKELLLQHLLADEGVAALVGDRISWVTRPRRGALPAIVLTQQSGVRDEAMSGPTGLVFSEIEINCWGLSPASATAVSRAVNMALKGTRETVDGIQIQKISLVQEHDFTEEGATPDEVLHYVSQDWTVWHSE